MSLTNLSKVAFFIALFAIEFLATTTKEIPIVGSIWDKANHFTAFFTLYILLSMGFKNLSITVKAILLLGFGMQIEIVQSFIDGRYFSLLDVVADLVGIVLGIMFYKILGSRYAIFK